MSVTIGGDQLMAQNATFNAQVPPEGPLAIPATLRFDQASQITVDFTLQMERKTVTAIQGIVVRNWNNGQPITIVVQGTQEYIDVPAFCDAYLQVASTNRAKFIFTSTGGVAVPVVFFNVPISPLIIYSPNGGLPVVITGTIDVDVVNAVTVTGTLDTIPAQQGTIAPAGTTVATGGTPVTVFANPAAPVRVLNPQGATEPLFLDLLHNAGTVESGSTMMLQPGQSMLFPPFTGTLTANAQTSGHVFTAWGPAE